MKIGFTDDPAPKPGGLLTVELVPSSSWGDNLRSRLKQSAWDRLRRASYKAAGHRCEICGGKGRRHPVECHEVWVYNDTTHVQTLERLISLCPSCHEVKHLGLAELRGRQDIALRHLAKVNGWTPTEALRHVTEAFEVWQRRSRHTWTLDLSWLAEQGEEIPT